MVSYGDGGWEARSQIRKAVRDEVRKAFWAQAGVSAHTNSRTFEGAPKSQRVSVLRLMQVTRDEMNDPDLKIFFGVVAKAMNGIGFGKGVMGEVSRTVEDLNQYHTRALEHFFTKPYRFDGPRDKPE